MSLASLQIRSAEVLYNGQPITLYGLSANDIAGLIASQLSSIEKLFDIVEGHGVKKAEDLAKLNIAEVGQSLLTQMPSFIAHVIAYGSHEPESWETAMHLDAPTQVKCIKEIALLTFNDQDGFKEFVGNVVAALRSAKGVVPQSATTEGSVSQAVNASLNGGSASAPPSHS
jgi:hypothetical protein